MSNTTVSIMANGNEIGTAATNGAGEFTYSYKFGDAGTYAITTGLNYQGKALESPPASLKVDSPSLVPPSLVLPAVAVVVVLAAVVGFLILKSRGAHA